jgi:hypothetical protein
VLSKARFTQAKLFICTDIEREIQLATADKTALQSLGVHPGGANFLAALGLLCYTEFFGKLLFKEKPRRRTSIPFSTISVRITSAFV